MTNGSRARFERDPRTDAAADRQLLLTVARLVRRGRRAIGWKQRQLGEVAGLSQAAISLIEGACMPSLSVVTANRVLDSLGIRAELRAHEPSYQDRDRQRDPAHARCVAFVRARLERAGWQTASEVEIGRGRFRRWIDILAYHPIEHRLLVIEIKTEIDDIGEIERALSSYERGSWAAARDLGWRPRSMTGCLLALWTSAVDARVVANSSTFEVGFPIRATALTELIAQPTIAVPRGIRAVALIDPLSRRADWLRGTRLDGRRTPAPYANYADFIRHVRPRVRPTRPPV
jgi:transcriptional regulator with XRE-family HTH domain